MGSSRQALEERIHRHVSPRREATPAEVVDGLVEAMLAENARAGRARPPALSLFAFVGAQVRYVPVWTWVAHLTLVALMWAIARYGSDAGLEKVSVGALSAMTVLVCVPTVLSSKRHKVIELEYSCRNNAATVMLARMLIFGCSTSLTVFIMVILSAASLNLSALTVALWACPPFFCSISGSLQTLRKSPPSLALSICTVWCVLCTAVLVGAAAVVPDLYGSASTATWLAASGLALTWLVRELIACATSVMAGLDGNSLSLTQTLDQTRTLTWN